MVDIIQFPFCSKSGLPLTTMPSTLCVPSLKTGEPELPEKVSKLDIKYVSGILSYTLAPSAILAGSPFEVVSYRRK